MVFFMYDKPSGQKKKIPVKTIRCQDPVIIDTLVTLTLKLPGEGQMALPLNLNDKNIPNADIFLVF